MIKKLLFIFIVGLSFNVYSQAVAHPVPNLEQCDFEIFDLTVQNGNVLGNQNPAQFTIGYFLSMTAANTNTNPIPNPNVFVGGMTNQIYIRVTNTQDNTYAVTSFTASWYSTPQAITLSDTTACDSFELPPLPPDHQYFYSPDGNGAIYDPGSLITATQTFYIWATNGPCGNGTSFTVTILYTPIPPNLPDVVACDSHILETLPPGMSYNTGAGGSGDVIPLSTIITSSQTIYIFGTNGTCSAESNFDVTIINTPQPVEIPDVYSCSSYTLPELPAGYGYSTATGGGGSIVPAGAQITQTTTLFIFGQTGTTPNCTSEQEWQITIGAPLLILDSLQGCDYNNDGFATFNLIEGIPYEVVMSGAVISFHETATDANYDFNAIEMTEAYQNYISWEQQIHVRIALPGGCFSVTELLLVAVECSNNTISGMVILDVNNDGCDATDPPMTNAQVTLTNGDAVMYSYLNNLGEYTFYGAPQGDNYISLSDLPLYYTPPPTQLVLTTGNDDTDVANFCVAGPAPVNDAQLTLSSWMSPVPGFQMTYLLSIQNLGTTVLSGSTTFTYDNSILNYNGSAPGQASQTANTITFNYNNLQPSDYLTYNLYFTVFTPPTVVSGDLLVVSASTEINTTDIDLTNNMMTLEQTVVNSYDPNDISVHEGPFITEEQADDYLHYTIRFQNSGTAPAVNVRLENSLEPNLDWSTFMPLAASHTYLTQRDGGNLTFRFNNIMLPAEQDDEPGSHGWITYKVKPAPGFAIGDIISNTANIFFDFNEAIVTNTVTTQIQQLSVADHDLASIKLYPNPAAEMAFFSGFSGSLQVQVYNVQGKRIKSEILLENQPFDVSNIEAGMYFVKISGEGKMITRKLIVK